MKRLLSSVLTIVILCSALLSCGESENDADLTMGQWLSLVSDSFGFQNYTSETPYFKNVTKSDYAFSVFQAAAEWNIIEPSDKITSKTPVKWNDVLISLVNAGEFLDSDATSEEKIDFAIEHFDSSIKKYWGNRYIKLEDAMSLLDKSQNMWAKKVYTENIQTATFSDNVKDFSQQTGIEYIATEEIITSNSPELAHLKPGDVYTLPANNMNSVSINKVESIKYAGGNVVITNDSNFSEGEIAQYIQNIKIQETLAPDFSKFSGIYDEYGNPIDFQIDNNGSIDNNTDANISLLGASLNNSNYNFSQTGIFDNAEATLKFEVELKNKKKYSVSLSLRKDEFSLRFACKDTLASNRYRERTREAYVQTTFKDVEITKDIDYSYGVLKSATAKLAYNTTIEGGIKTERSQDIGSIEGNKTQSISSIINQYKNAIENHKKDIRNSKCEDEIYICKIALAEGGFASIDFVIKGKVTAEGDVKLILEIGGAQGVQIKGNNIRYIKTQSTDLDFVAEATLEATVSPGLEISILKKLLIIDITIELGAGVSTGMTAHLLDIEGHKLYSGTTKLTAEDAELLSQEKLYTTAEELEKFANEHGVNFDASKYGGYGENIFSLRKGICLEWQLYPIVRVNISGEKSFVGKLMKKLKVELGIEILGSKNTTLQGHIDFPNSLKNVLESDSFSSATKHCLGINAECTYDLIPWDSATEIVEDSNPSHDTLVMIGDLITLSSMRIEVKKGESTFIEVTALPKGYDLDDIEAKSYHESIVKVDSETGKVTGLKEGNTLIVIKTKDGKYEAFCAVSVSDDKTFEINKLSHVFSI